MNSTFKQFSNISNLRYLVITSRTAIKIKLRMKRMILISTYGKL